MPKNRDVSKTGEETGLQFHVCVCVFVCFNHVRFYLQQGLLVLQTASVSAKMFLVEKLSPVNICVPFLIIFSLLLLFTCY